MEAGRKFNPSLAVAEVAKLEDFQNAFAMMRDTRPGGLLVMADPLIGDQIAQVIAFVASARLPAIYDIPAYANAGGMVA